MIDISLRKIIKEVAEELGHDPTVVSTAVSSEFKFVALKIKENEGTQEDPIIKLNFLGKFLVKDGRRFHIKFKKDKFIDAVMSFIKGKDVSIK